MSVFMYYGNKAREVTSELALKRFYLSTDRDFPDNLDYIGESHDFWEVVYVNRGEAEVTEDENVYLLGEGDIIFHAPMEFHRIKKYGEGPLNIINLSFGIEGTPPANLASGVFHMDEKERKEFLSISEEVREWIENSEDKFFGLEIAARWEAFFLRLSRIDRRQNKRVSTERVHTYKQLVEIMNDEIHKNISIVDVAERMFVSVSYVKVLFKRYAGISPKAYYTNLQIQEAAKMLDEGKSVREVSEQMNFSTASYFSVFFKKHTGMTPKQYRNLVKKA